MFFLRYAVKSYNNHKHISCFRNISRFLRPIGCSTYAAPQCPRWTFKREFVDMYIQQLTGEKSNYSKELFASVFNRYHFKSRDRVTPFE